MSHGPYEAELAAVLFSIIAERVDREGVVDLDDGYLSAIRDERPWCVGVSLGILADLGWHLSVTVDTPTHSVPANVNLSAVLAEAIADRVWAAS
jgi:hypothetical protein